MRRFLRDVRLTGGHETRLIVTDPSPIAILLVMPAILILFLKNGLVPPVVEGQQAANGASQAVPGIGAMFAFFLVGYTGLAFFREHGWNTWNRIRVSPIGTPGLIVGKSLPYVALGITQLWVLIAVGWLFLELRIEGSLLAILSLIVLMCMAAVSLGLLMTAYSSSIQHLYAISNLAAVLLGGIGGAFASVSSYPKWAQLVAQATPQFWAIDGLKRVIVGGASVGDVSTNLLVLFAFSVFFTLLAVSRFDTSEVKQSFLD